VVQLVGKAPTLENKHARVLHYTHQTYFLQNRDIFNTLFGNPCSRPQTCTRLSWEPR
jgi:hypothetical protein